MAMAIYPEGWEEGTWGLLLLGCLCLFPLEGAFSATSQNQKTSALAMDYAVHA